MEVQPSLVLLQKTLLNIEGLGRQLYPQLDLWTTAKPFLEKWLKKRYSPSSIVKQMKRHLPDWLEYLPQIPPLIFDELQSKQASRHNVLLSEPVSTKATKFTGRIGAAAVGVAIGMAFPHWADPISMLPGSSLLLATVGLLILLLR
jgi:ubiquinone biosynthesis protein